VVGTSIVPLFLATGGVLSAVAVWQLTLFSRLIGRSSVVLASAVGDGAVKVRCGFKIKGAPGEGSFMASWPLATLVVVQGRVVVQSPVGDWDFPRQSSAVELTGRSSPFASVLLRCGPLSARVAVDAGDIEKVALALQHHGWFGHGDAAAGPATG
jgi:hypothetical protein